MSLQHGFRLLSAYHASAGDMLWVITEADPGDRDVTQTYSKLKEWGVVRDAATVFGRVLTYLRDDDFLGGNRVNGYPAVVSDRPESNSAVRIARGEVFFDGQPCQKLLERL